MKKIKINVSKPYDVLIQKEILSQTGNLISNIRNNCKVVVVSDDRVFSLYGNNVCNSLNKADFKISYFTFKNGEPSKNMSTALKITEYFSKCGLTRNDLVIALGGGVVGDLVGFASSIYLRGIPFVQVPTTLLSMIDSSIGGKTGVNSTFGKNLIGTFYQPKLVICDPNVLNTLHKNDFLDGISEAIKYGIIQDKELFLKLQSKNYDIEDIIENCISIKKSIIVNDEFDTGIRQTLNFGHTIGHAVEKLSNYQISHGRGVAIGMVAITKSVEKALLCKHNISEKITNILDIYNIDYKCDYISKDIANIVLSDKKRKTDKITLVLPQSIGQVYLKEFNINDIEDFLSLGIGK